MKKLSYLIVVAVLIGLIGCDGSSSYDTTTTKKKCPKANLDIAVCDPSAGPFSLTIDNEFFPLAVGDATTLEGDDNGVTVTVDITVLDETEDVAGVTTRVVEEAEYEDGTVVEISRNFYAQAPDGTVCYFGEDVDIYDGGVVVSHDGAWRAGVDGALPGIMMPGFPEVDDVFYQESAAGVAKDMSEITGFGDTLVTPAGTFTDTLSATDCNPLEKAEKDKKVYVSGIGLAKDEVMKLISY